MSRALKTTVYLNREDYKKLRAMAAREGTTAAFMVREAVAKLESGRDLAVNRVSPDGIDTGPKTLELLKNKVPEDWPGQELIINDGIFVGGLRVSDTVRYEENFPRPEAHFEADEHTRVLCTFDGSGEAWLFGKKHAIR